MLIKNYKTVVFLITYTLFLKITKNLFSNADTIICFYHKLLTILSYYYKENLPIELYSFFRGKNTKKSNLFNKISLEQINLCIISYYLYSITNHFKLNTIDFYMLLHHTIVLSFFINNKYSKKEINYIHGNLIIADFPNVVFELFIHRHFIPKNIKNICIVFADLFFIIYKILYINLFFYNANKYYYNKKQYAQKMQKIILEMESHMDFNVFFIFNLMYLAIYFKTTRINRKLNIKNNYFKLSIIPFYLFFLKYAIQLNYQQ